MNKTPPVAIRGTVVFGFSLLALPFGAYVILACGRELVTTMRKSSPSIFGRSSQYTASPVAWLMADRCIMGRPTASWLLWSFETGWWGRGSSRVYEESTSVFELNHSESHFVTWNSCRPGWISLGKGCIFSGTSSVITFCKNTFKSVGFTTLPCTISLK